MQILAAGTIQLGFTKREIKKLQIVALIGLFFAAKNRAIS